jgi:hypothetical protein
MRRANCLLECESLAAQAETPKASAMPGVRHFANGESPLRINAADTAGLKPPDRCGSLNLRMKRLVAVVCTILLLAGGIFLALRPAQPVPLAPVVVMPLPYSIPRQKVSLFDRWVPRQLSWAWLWRLKETVVGRPKVCDLTATVIDFTRSGEAFLTALPLPKPEFADTTGLSIWLFTEAELSALRPRLRQTPGAEVLHSPRLTTANGMRARLMSGNTIPIQGVPASVGVSVDFLPRLRPEATDITTIITLSEAITNRPGTTAGSSLTGATCVQTNFAVAARIQVPKAGGVFLLEGPSAAANQKRIGVLLSVNSPKPKK